MMLHPDGSRNIWIPTLGRAPDMIVTLDDATSAIYLAALVGEEGAASMCFRPDAKWLRASSVLLAPQQA
jgi:hypothetical protein